MSNPPIVALVSWGSPAVAVVGCYSVTRAVWEDDVHWLQDQEEDTEVSNAALVRV
jgi:hypothetical protein